MLLVLVILIIFVMACGGFKTSKVTSRPFISPIAIRAGKMTSEKATAATVGADVATNQGVGTDISVVKGQTGLLVDLWAEVTFPRSSSSKTTITTTSTSTTTSCKANGIDHEVKEQEEEEEEEEEEGAEFKLSDYGLNRRTTRGLLAHFQACKDCGGDGALLMATQNERGEDVLRLNEVAFPLLSDDEEDGEGWGSHVEEDLRKYEEAAAAAAAAGRGEGGIHWDQSSSNSNSNNKDKDVFAVFPEESDDGIVLRDSKEWVRRLVADFAVCPFTMTPDRAGIPQASVRYMISRADTTEEAFLRYWQEIQALLQAKETEISTSLLVFPDKSLFGNYEVFETFCECLSDALCDSTLGLERTFQLVFFHPEYRFRDGHARLGDEKGAANYARRSPWPMVNILRTSQVRVAQRGVPTAQVYQQNEKRLTEVGTGALRGMLSQRDWSSLPIYAAGAKRRRNLEASREEEKG